MTNEAEDRNRAKVQKWEILNLRKEELEREELDLKDRLRLIENTDTETELLKLEELQAILTDVEVALRQIATEMATLKSELSEYFARKTPTPS